MSTLSGKGQTVFRHAGQDAKNILHGDLLQEAQVSVFELVLAKTNVRRYGGPALAATAERGQWGFAQDLQEHGADVNAHVPYGKSVLMLAIKYIGNCRESLSPRYLSTQKLTAAELKKRRDDAADEDKEALAFLKELLRRHPNLNEISPPDNNGEEETRTALSIARYWKLPDVEALLTKAGARR